MPMTSRDAGADTPTGGPIITVALGAPTEPFNPKYAGPLHTNVPGKTLEVASKKDTSKAPMITLSPNIPIDPVTAILPQIKSLNLSRNFKIPPKNPP